MINANEIKYLIQGIQFKEPKLFDALSKVADGLNEINKNTNDLTALLGPFIIPGQVTANLPLYSKGTFTPIIGGATSESGQTYSHNIGNYIRIGDFVFAHFSALLSAKGTITGAVQVKGLPFKSLKNTNSYSVGHIGYFANLATNWMSLSGFIGTDTTALNMYGTQAAAATVTALATADIANTTWFIGQCIYQTNEDQTT